MSGVCCICKRRFGEYGNNPWPIVKDYATYCCDECNMMFVIPARIELAMTRRE